MKIIVGVILVVVNFCLPATYVLAHSDHRLYDSESSRQEILALKQVQRLIEKGSQLGEQDYYLQAEQLLDEIKQPSNEVRLYKAQIQQYFHNFDTALELLSVNKDDPAAILLRASIYFTQGKARQAHSECKQLFGQVDNLLAITCMAQANSLLGELNKSYKVLEAAITHVKSDDKESLAWSYVVLAEMAERLSDNEQALSFYKKALAINENDIPSRIAYSDILLKEKRFKEVLSLTKNYLHNDLLMLRYVRALNIQGDLRASDHFCELKRRVLNYTDKNRHLHYDLFAEYYLYFSTNFEYSLQWAKRHWQQQKTPRDARLLAKVAIQAADQESLDQITQWRTTLMLEDKNYDQLVNQSWLVSLN